MIVYTENKPCWLKKIDNKDYNDKQFIRIIKFFVFHSPVEGLSARQISLADYGWETPWRKPYYLNKQLKASSSNYKLIFSSATYDKMDDALNKSNLMDVFPSDITKERICILNCKNNQFMSVFYHLRNAFAHGRFNFVKKKNEEYYILEDVKGEKEKFKVSARMILKKSTLIKWMDIIQGGVKEYGEFKAKFKIED